MVWLLVSMLMVAMAEVAGRKQGEKMEIVMAVFTLLAILAFGVWSQAFLDSH